MSRGNSERGVNWSDKVADVMNKTYIEFLGYVQELGPEEAAAFERLKKDAIPFVFEPEPKGLYCNSESELGCTTLPCSCPDEFLEIQKRG